MRLINKIMNNMHSLDSHYKKKNKNSKKLLKQTNVRAKYIYGLERYEFKYVNEDIHRSSCRLLFNFALMILQLMMI